MPLAPPVSFYFPGNTSAERSLSEACPRKDCYYISCPIGTGSASGTHLTRGVPGGSEVALDVWVTKSPDVVHQTPAILLLTQTLKAASGPPCRNLSKTHFVHCQTDKPLNENVGKNEVAIRTTKLRNCIFTCPIFYELVLVESIPLLQFDKHRVQCFCEERPLWPQSYL